MKPVINYIKDNAWVRYVGLFMLGCAIGAIFYPSKTIIREVKVEDTEKIERLTKELTNTKKEHADKLDQQEKTSKKKITEFSSKVTSLKSEVHDLKSKVKTSYYKLIKPDGTIEERRFTESEVTESTKVVESIRSEFNKKVTEIEDKWMTIHRERLTKITVEHKKEVDEYIERIHKLESKEEIKINERNTQVELGMLTNSNYYMHVTRELFGPFFLGVHTQAGFGLVDDPGVAIGGGLGLRW